MVRANSLVTFDLVTEGAVYDSFIKLQQPLWLLIDLNTMHQLKRILALAAFCAVSFAGLHAQAFVRPLVGLVEPRDSDASSGTYLGLVSGYYWRGADSSVTKEVSVEFGRAKWDYDTTILSYGVHGEESYVPVVLNLRAHVDIPEELQIPGFRFYIGPSIGTSYAKYEVSIKDSGGSTLFADDDSNWVFTYGASAGFVVPIYKAIDLDIGYRFIHLDGDDVEIAGQNMSISSSSVHVLYMGIGYRF